MNNAPIITAAERDLMEEHVPYEIWMLRSTYDVVVKKVPMPGVLLNACIESFAVHARALTNFFVGTTRPDDARAKDFCTSSYSAPTGELIPRPLREKLNRQIAHIHKDVRAKIAAEKLNAPRDFQTIRKALEPEIENFIGHLQPRFQSIWAARGAAPPIANWAP